MCVTGGAGFIGSNFVDLLLSKGIQVRVIDNFRTGRYEFVDPRVELYNADVLHEPNSVLLKAFDGCDWVAHFQANADVRHGLERPFFDIEQNTVATSKVLDAMRQTGVKNIFFSSTASVYGGVQMDRIPEDCPFPIQQSLYGASKVACEGLLAAYHEGFDFNAVVGRWVQVVGERYLHGSIIDFTRKLLNDPDRLYILGDGTQEKSGIYVQDLVRGIWTAIQENNTGPSGYEVYNIGTDSTVSVKESAAIVCDVMNVDPVFEYSGRKNGGWVGDNPRVLLDTTKIKDIGWKPQTIVSQAIRKTTEWLLSPECTYL